MIGKLYQLHAIDRIHRAVFIGNDKEAPATSTYLFQIT